MRINTQINGKPVQHNVEPRVLLSDFLRHYVGLTGTHIGCEHGACGACTIQLDGQPVRACLLFAVQAHGRAIRTVEGLMADGELHPLQQAFHEEHALQCGFCTPGLLMALEPHLGTVSELDDVRIRELIAGNLCRCTGYQNIVSAVRETGRRMHEGTADWERGRVQT